MIRGWLTGACLRWIATSVLMGVLVWQWGDHIARAALQPLRAAYTLLDDRHRIVSFSLGDRGALGAHDKVYQLQLAPQRLVVIGTRVINPNEQGRASVSVLAAYLWQSWLVALPLVLAWPAQARRQYVLRLLIVLPLLLALSLLDLPLVLWAEVWRMYIDAFTPGAWSALIAWAGFLQHGGRLALGVIAAIIAVELVRHYCAVGNHQGKPLSP